MSERQRPQKGKPVDPPASGVRHSATVPWLSLESTGPIPVSWLRQASNDQAANPPPAPFRSADDSWICRCPDCGAPVLVRRWLMSADCWQCGTSLWISEQRDP